jgi:Ser/Thr protein kinase RdoA (MazF antagonist)
LHATPDCNPEGIGNWVDRQYGLSATDVALVRAGENTTFRVLTAGRDFALRIHRPGYQTEGSIRSELAWTESLRQSGVRTARPLPGVDGRLVQRVDDGRFSRPAVLFEWIDGTPMSQVDRLDLWQRLGELAAAIHEHGRSWPRPGFFSRPAWDVESLVGSAPRWGDPIALGDWSAAEARMLRRARDAVRRRLVAFGDGPQNFGLIHADLAFENVLVCRGGKTVLLDFDDGGPGWFVYELAVSLFPYEGEADFERRRDALAAGYRKIRHLAADALAELPTFLMARRLATLGWTFTRSETEHAARHRERRLAMLAERASAYLDWVEGAH